MSIPKAPIANVTSLPERKPNVDRPDREQSYLWHWLGFHKWTKWSEPKEKSANLSDALTGQTIWYQSRYCEVCNIHKRRLVK